MEDDNCLACVNKLLLVQPKVDMTIFVFSTASSYGIPGCAQALLLQVALPEVWSKPAVVYGAVLTLMQSIARWERGSLLLGRQNKIYSPNPRFSQVPLQGRPTPDGRVSG